MSRNVPEEHRNALDRFVSDARAFDASAWREPGSGGKWSAAEITSHLVQTYEALLAELAGGPPLKIRTKWWQRVVLRMTALPRILRTGQFPAGVPAPKELRPRYSEEDHDALLGRLSSLGGRFGTEASAPGARPLTHPYLGRFSAAQALRFCSIHVEHHRKQLLALAEKRLQALA